jgi:hypothetical protein
MQLTATVVTDAGMHLVWDRAHFAGVRDYDTWSKELEEDQAIRDHIVAGHIVPVNIHRDGSFTLTVRVESSSMPSLSEAEERHVAARSEPYRFACQGHVDVSGIEYVHSEAGRLVASMELLPGSYDVVVHLMDYDDVLQRTDAHPDFVITIGPARAQLPRQSVDTFSKNPE